MSVIRSTLDTNSEVYKTATSTMNTKLAEIEVEHAKALAGGGEKYTERHHKRGKAPGTRADRTPARSGFTVPRTVSPRCVGE